MKDLWGREIPQEEIAHARAGADACRKPITAPATEITQEAALFCERCRRYRRFHYLERRLLQVAPNTVHAITGPRGSRVIGHFYTCETCGHQQQWGCSG